MDRTEEQGIAGGGLPSTCPHLLESCVRVCLATGMPRFPSDHEARQFCLDASYGRCPRAARDVEEARTGGKGSLVSQVLRLLRADLLGDGRVRGR